MILKTISIVLPKKMIQEIDEMLLEKNFASRSDYFRHLVRMWQIQEGQENPTKESEKKLDKSPGDEFANVDCEFGIPMEVIKVLEEKAKLLN